MQPEWCCSHRAVSCPGCSTAGKAMMSWQRPLLHSAPAYPQRRWQHRAAGLGCRPRTRLGAAAMELDVLMGASSLTSSYHALDAVVVAEPAPICAITEPLPSSLPEAHCSTGTLPPPVTFQTLATAGSHKASLPAAKIYVSGILAGCYLAFGGILTCCVQAGMQSLLPTLPGLVKLVGGLVFPIGLTLITLSGVELYTGNTSILPMAVYEKRASVGGLMRNWFWSYAGNLTGSLMIVAAASTSGLLEGNIVSIQMAEAKAGLPFLQAFMRALLANWLVCMAIWHTTAATSVPGKILSLWPPITTFMTTGMEHSIANMFLVPMGIALGANVSISSFLVNNLLPVTLGNTLAGFLCVGTAFSFLYGSLGRKARRPQAALC